MTCNTAINDCFPHVLTIDMYILLGITCTDFDNSLARLMTKPTLALQHGGRTLQQSLKQKPNFNHSNFVDLTVTPKQQRLSPSSPIILTDSPSPASLYYDTQARMIFFRPDPSSRTNGKAWLASMYVMDMQLGFVAMDSQEVTKRLEKVGRSPPNSFHEQGDEDALAAGRSSEGLWSMFVS